MMSTWTTWCPNWQKIDHFIKLLLLLNASSIATCRAERKLSQAVDLHPEDSDEIEKAYTEWRECAQQSEFSRPLTAKESAFASAVIEVGPEFKCDLRLAFATLAIRERGEQLHAGPRAIDKVMRICATLAILLATLYIMLLNIRGIGAPLSAHALFLACTLLPLAFVAHFWDLMLFHPYQFLDSLKQRAEGVVLESF